MNEIFKLEVRAPRDLVGELTQIAQDRYTSRNSIIIEALREYVDNKKADCTRQSNQSALSNHLCLGAK